MSYAPRPNDLGTHVQSLDKRIRDLERTLQTAGKVAATDANGVLRFLGGPLDDAGGGYAGQFGFYLADATGALIADSVGLAQVMSSLASAQPAGAVGAVYAASFTDLHSVSFTLTRTQTVLLVVSTSFYASTIGTANFITIRAAIESSGVPIATSGQAYCAVAGGSAAINNGTLSIRAQLAAGTYTGAIQYVMQGGATTQVSDLHPQLDVYLLGK